LDYEIPTIELRDLFDKAGLDMQEIHADLGYPTIDEPLFEEFLLSLPEEIRQEYGIDFR
jgi:hypothetical protein